MMEFHIKIGDGIGSSGMRAATAFSISQVSTTFRGASRRPVIPNMSRIPRIRYHSNFKIEMFARSTRIKNGFVVSLVNHFLICRHITCVQEYFSKKKYIDKLQIVVTR